MNPPPLNIAGSGWKFFYGRILHEGLYHVGKVDAGYSQLTLQVVTSTGGKSFTSGFEVLTCGN